MKFTLVLLRLSVVLCALAAAQQAMAEQYYQVGSFIISTEISGESPKIYFRPLSRLDLERYLADPDGFSRSRFGANVRYIGLGFRISEDSPWVGKAGLTVIDGGKGSAIRYPVGGSQAAPEHWTILDAGQDPWVFNLGVGYTFSF